MSNHEIDPAATAASLASDLDAVQQQTQRLDQALAAVQQQLHQLENPPANHNNDNDTSTGTNSSGDSGGGGGPEHVTPPSRSWFQMRADPDAEAHLPDLVLWVDEVYLRYADAMLPECWAWHPAVVEELTWLRDAWQAAYLDTAASWHPLPAEWHTRYRPPVAQRIKDDVGNCTVRRHQDGTNVGHTPVPLPTAATDVAAWWSTTDHRDGDLPPTDTHLAEADQYVQEVTS